MAASCTGASIPWSLSPIADTQTSYSTCFLVFPEVGYWVTQIQKSLCTHTETRFNKNTGSAVVIKHWTWSDLFTLFLPLFFPLVPPWSFSFNSYVPSTEQPITSLLIFIFFFPKTSRKFSPSSKSRKSWTPVGNNALSLHEMISAKLSFWVSHQEQSNLLPFVVS